MGKPFPGLCYLIEPNRTYWSDYSKHENYKAGLGWYNNAIGGTLNDMGVKPHIHKETSIKIESFTPKQSIDVVNNNLHISTREDDCAKIEIYSINGSLIHRYEKRRLQVGTNAIALPKNLGSGLFIISIKGETVDINQTFSIR